MKYRESGMPDEEMWNVFFDPQFVLESLGVSNDIENIIDIGCGYGTFLIHASQIISGIAIGIDIDQAYLDICQKKLDVHSLKKTFLINGDISRPETNQKISAIMPEADYISLFNILHCEAPVELMKNALKLLKVSGKVGVVHWIQGETPRGPSLSIRPNPETIIQWGIDIGLVLKKQVQLPPYHFGLLFEKQLY